MNYAFYEEGLRKFSVAPMLERTCVQDYVIPGTDKVIKKGIDVLIPIFALHRNEEFYENPLMYDPERFNDENKVGKNQVNRPYYPFGMYS